MTLSDKINSSNSKGNKSKSPFKNNNFSPSLQARMDRLVSNSKDSYDHIDMLDLKKKYSSFPRSSYPARKIENDVMSRNMRFVLSVARNYLNQGVEIEDLYGAGMKGLLKGWQTFDEKKNIKFTTHSVWHIRQAILIEIAEMSRIYRLPPNRNTDAYKVRKAYHKLSKESLEPEIVDVAKGAGLSKEDAMVAFDTLQKPSYFESDVKGCNGISLYEMFDGGDYSVEDHKSTGIKAQLEIIADEHLTEKESIALFGYFGINEAGFKYTLKELGKALEVTGERARQIKNTALSKLRKCNLESYGLTRSDIPY